VALLIKQEIDNRIERLPEKLSDALFDFDNVSLISDIQANYRLTDSQSSNLSKITGRVIMGFIIIDSLVGKIANSLNVDQTTAERIADILNKKIFNSIKPDIENFRKQMGAKEISDNPNNVVNLKQIITQKNNPFSQVKSISNTPPVFGLNRNQISTSQTPKPLEQVLITKPQPIQKDFIRSETSVTPFIIHQESEVEPIAPNIPMRTNIPEIAMGNFSEEKTPESIEARVEIGQTFHEQKHIEKNSPVFTARPDHKIINYNASAPQINDPFSNIGPKEAGPKVVGNTIDLSNKDNG